MKESLFRIAVFIGALSGATGVSLAAALPLSLPGPIQKPVDTPRVTQLNRQNQKYPTYMALRETAEIYLSQGRYDDAARAYRQEADLFRRNGFKDAALSLETTAARYDTQVRIFQERALEGDEKTELNTKALWEPSVGAYAGAYINLDDQLPDAWRDRQGRIMRKPEVFEKVVGKSHATYFMYIGYGQPVPFQWLEQCKRVGAIAHLAFEPNDLNAVKDDEYLRYFAKACGKLDMPIFLRYASEMNGTWTAWHGNPTLYREKFRIVHRVFKQYAPKVATIWCVNSVPTDTIDDYYPGDEFCDWVGVNVYSVPFYGNDPKRSGLLDSALPYIEPIYQMYSARKPIAICEFASSHMAAVDKVPRTDFAISRMEYLYQALPRFYPRIKMISWFSVNTIRHGAVGAPNNYALTEDHEVLDSYRTLIQNPYFLGASSWNKPQNSPATMPRLIRLGEPVSGVINLSLWIKTVLEKPKVYLSINNALIYAQEGNGVHNISINTATLASGPKRLRVYVFDEQNRFVTTAATTVTVGRSRALSGQPLQIGGIVQRFYLDRAGLISAMDIETAGTQERINFDPRLARQLMQDFPNLVILACGLCRVEPSNLLQMRLPKVGIWSRWKKNRHKCRLN